MLRVTSSEDGEKVERVLESGQRGKTGQRKEMGKETTEVGCGGGNNKAVNNSKTETREGKS